MSPRDAENFVDSRQASYGFADAVLEHGLHTVLDGLCRNLIRRCAPHDEVADVVLHFQALKNTNPADITGVAAAGTALAAVKADGLTFLLGEELLDGSGRQPGLDLFDGHLIAHDAALADLADQALGDDEVDRRGDEERLDFHVAETPQG